MTKVLLVDDEPHVLSVLNIFLKKNNYEVLTANNGRQALESVINNNPDIIITDIQMPKMTGQDLCEEINSQFPESDKTLIVMTSRTDTELREWAKKHNNIIFMEKPLSPRTLVAKLRELVSENHKMKDVS